MIVKLFSGVHPFCNSFCINTLTDLTSKSTETDKNNNIEEVKSDRYG